METRTPSIPRDGAGRHGGRGGIRRWGAALASVLLHGALGLAVTLPALMGREPPRIEVEEPIAVELVTEAAIGLRTPRQAADLPIEAADAARPDAAAMPSRPDRTELAAAGAPPETAAVAPPEVPAPAAPPPPEPPASPIEGASPAAPAAAPLPIATVGPAPAIAPAAPAPAATPSAAAARTEATSRADDAEAVPVAAAPGPVLGLAPAASGPVDAGPIALEPSDLVVAGASSPDPAGPSPVGSAPLASAPAGDAPPAVEPATAPAAGPVALAALPPVAPPAPPPVAVAPVDPRAAVDAVLKGLDCARVGATLDALAGILVLRGHVPTAESRDRLVSALAAEPGIRRVDASGLGLMGEPYCRILAFLDRPDFARSTEQRGDLAAIGAANPPGLRRLRGGDALDLHVAAPDFDSYLYVDHFSADGRVTHLLPTSRPDNALRADESFGLGPEGRGRRAIAAPPYGLDVVTVLAASEPLLPPGRPIQEDAATYLAALDTAVRRLAAAGRTPRYEYGYYLVTTEPPAGEIRPAAAPRPVRGRPGG